MPDLLVSNIDDEIIDALKAQANKHGISTEEEHRRILLQALLGLKKKSFTEALQAIPNVGEDADFGRV